MKRPDIENPELADIVCQLETGSIRPQDAMAKILPFIMASKTSSDLKKIEPVKDYILSWKVHSLEN